MANFSGQIVFRLVLVIVMVMQPIAVSYAMANMGLSSSSPSALSKAGHDQCHVMSQDVSVTQADSHESTGMNDCCKSAACCPAVVVVDDNTMMFIPTPSFTAHFPVAWGNVILPSEIRPPRSLLS